MTTFQKRKNKFSKIKHHLKSSQIDEKLQLLSEIPTNNTSGIYFIEPEKIEIIPAVLADLNLTADSNPDGTDTSGLFGNSGEILTEEPPGDTSYILGPMVSVYFPDGDYTAVGYIQENTRKVINLARISGPLEQWNGIDGFVSYSQLTLEQANWYKDQYLANKVEDYRVFYIGIFETIQSQVFDPGVGVDIDALGRWFGKIINTAKTLIAGGTQTTPAVTSGPDPNIVPGSANPTKKKTYTIDDFKSAADYSAYKAGGGDAALKQGKSLQDVINQGKKNLGTYDSTTSKTSLTQADFSNSNDYDYYKAGGGDAALKSGKTVQDVVNQGKVNVVDKYSSQSNPWLNIDNWKKDPIKTLDSLVQDLMMVGPGAGSNPIKVVSTINALQAAKTAQGIVNASDVIMNMPGKYTAAKGTGAITPPKVQVNGKWVDISSPEASGNWTAKQIWNTNTGKYDVVTNKDGLKWDWAQRVIDDALFSHWTKTGEMPPGLQGWDIPKAFTPSLISTGVTPSVQKGATAAASAGAAVVGLDAGAAQGQNALINPDIITKGNQDPSSLSNDELDLYIQYLKSQTPQNSNNSGTIPTLDAKTSQQVDDVTKGLRNAKPGSSKESSLKKQAADLLLKMNPSDSRYDTLLNLMAPSSSQSEFYPESKTTTEVTFLQESHQTILRNIKKPIIIPEAKKEKIKHRPKVIGPAPRVIGSDLMKQAEVPTSFKPADDRLWGKYERQLNSRRSQERKNMVLDSIGTSDHAWEWLTEKNNKKSKNIMYNNFDIEKSFGKESNQYKNKIISKEQIRGDYLVKMYDENGKVITIPQSVLNERLHKEFERSLLNISDISEQETLQADKDPLVKRIAKKLKGQIDYPDKPSKLGYPNDPPPEMVNGWHSDYGQKVDYYKKLDNQSADTMSIPKTSNDEINSVVKNQTTKAQRIKNLIKNK